MVYVDFTQFFFFAPVRRPTTHYLCLPGDISSLHLGLAFIALCYAMATFKWSQNNTSVTITLQVPPSAKVCRRGCRVRAYATHIPPITNDSIFVVTICLLYLIEAGHRCHHHKLHHPRRPQGNIASSIWAAKQRGEGVQVGLEEWYCDHPDGKSSQGTMAGLVGEYFFPILLTFIPP